MHASMCMTDNSEGSSIIHKSQLYDGYIYCCMAHDNLFGYIFCNLFVRIVYYVAIVLSCIFWFLSLFFPLLSFAIPSFLACIYNYYSQ